MAHNLGARATATATASLRLLASGPRLPDFPGGSSGAALPRGRAKNLPRSAGGHCPEGRPPPEGGDLPPSPPAHPALAGHTGRQGSGGGGCFQTHREGEEPSLCSPTSSVSPCTPLPSSQSQGQPSILHAAINAKARAGGKKAAPVHPQRRRYGPRGGHGTGGVWTGAEKRGPGGGSRAGANSALAS